MGDNTQQWETLFKMSMEAKDYPSALQCARHAREEKWAQAVYDACIGCGNLKFAGAALALVGELQQVKQ